MYFLNDDDDVLEKYNIWDKVSADIKKKYDNEPIYKKNYKKKITMKLQIFTIKKGGF